MPSFNTSVMRTGSAGEETAGRSSPTARHESFDLVIMNPPFTKARLHEGRRGPKTIPSTAFGLLTHRLVDTDRPMASPSLTGRERYLLSRYAGIASAFAASGAQKDQARRCPGAWSYLCRLLPALGRFSQDDRDRYTDLTVLTIADADDDASVLRADTDMAECLVIARRLNRDEPPQNRVAFTSLRPQAAGVYAHASSLASGLLDGSLVRHIEDGPYGGTPLRLAKSWPVRK